jgi:hypothetical protein
MFDNAIYVISTISNDDVTAVKVGAVVDDWDTYEAIGVSKRDPRDKPNKSIAAKLALGRAIRQLGRDILHDGHAEVAQADAVRASQEAASAAGRERKAKRIKEAKKALKK